MGADPAETGLPPKEGIYKSTNLASRCCSAAPSSSAMMGLKLDSPSDFLLKVRPSNHGNLTVPYTLSASFSRSDHPWRLGSRNIPHCDTCSDGRSLILFSGETNPADICRLHRRPRGSPLPGDKSRYDHDIRTSVLCCSRRVRFVGLVAFVANGAVLPRASGASDEPMASPSVVTFQSPPNLEQSFNLPHRGEIRGMGVPAGITMIAGGGFHVSCSWSVLMCRREIRILMHRESQPFSMLSL